MRVDVAPIQRPVAGPAVAVHLRHGAVAPEGRRPVLGGVPGDHLPVEDDVHVAAGEGRAHGRADGRRVQRAVPRAVARLDGDDAPAHVDQVALAVHLDVAEERLRRGRGTADVK